MAKTTRTTTAPDPSAVSVAPARPARTTAVAEAISTSMTEPIAGSGSDPESVTGWMTRGNCRMYAPATFFPSDGVGVDRARKICASCPVLETCLEYALAERIEHGVWGGCSERERRRILKRRQLDDAGR